MSFTYTNEHKSLSRAASFGDPAARTKDGIALQRRLVESGLIKFAGYNQNSTTPRWRITEAGVYRLFELES